MEVETPLNFTQFMRDGFDPVPELSRRRDECPVSRLDIPGGLTAWLVTRYTDVRAVLAAGGKFSNDFSNLARNLDDALGGVQLEPGGLGFSDPPMHTRFRRLLAPHFAPRRLRHLVPRIREIVAQQLNVMERAGPTVDLVEDFAVPIPSLVICELLGVPYAERSAFLHFAKDRFDLSEGIGASLGAVAESLTYLVDLIARQRETPSGGLLGNLVREHGDAISDEELAGLVDGLLTGGHDTTAGMLALGSLLLLNVHHRDALVVEGECIDRVVEELLRYVSVVQVAFPRFAREQFAIGGQHVEKGEMVICSLSAANRDPALGSNMDRFDPLRPIESSHLAFGFGIHHCLGAHLARLEMGIAYPALFRRFPTLRLAVPESEIRFRALSIVHGIQSLPVLW